MTDVRRNSESPEIGKMLDLAIAAGAKILEFYAEPVAAVEKADGSPVTRADQAAEAIILKGLSASFPDIPAIAEEAVEAGHLPDVDDKYLLVDPLDGTREFIKRNGEFTVNIALIDAGVPVFGVVYAPAIGEIYWGGDLTKGTGLGGAYFGKVENAQLVSTESISVRSCLQDSVSILQSRSHMCAETSAFIDKFTVGERLSVGSSLKLCWLAAGKADLYPRYGPTMQWDIAAGHAVLRAAGGHVLCAGTQNELVYKVPADCVKDDLRNSSFVALNNPALLAKAN